MFTINPDGEFHDYIVDMSSNSQWTGWVNTLRFDPTTASSGHFEIEYIRFRRLAPDTTKPIGSVTINSGSVYTKTTSVTLNLLATDDLSGVIKMHLSNDGVFDTEAWENYTVSKSWTTTSGDGPKRVYAQFMDADGNISDTVNSLIILDSTAPNTPAAPTDAGAYSPTNIVTFTWTSPTDAISPIAGYNCQIGTTPGASNVFSGYITMDTTKSIMGTPTNTYYCRVQAKDAAGNYSAWSGSSDGVMVVNNPDVTIPSSKALPDNTSVGMPSKQISAIFDTYLYIEEANRTAGIRIVPSSIPIGLSVGSIIDVAGTLATTSEGERYLAGSLISEYGIAGTNGTSGN